MTAFLDLHDYRYGEGPLPPGLAIGVARHLPRGVPRTAYAARGCFEVWLPILAPSRELLKAFQEERISFPRFAQRYRREMREPGPRQVIRLLGTLAARQRVNLGCFCADPRRCHRTLLCELVRASAPEARRGRPARPGYASPACAMPEIED